MMDKREYEERYGEKVIWCRRHRMSGVGGCEACDDEEEWVSECCGSTSIGELDISTFGTTGFCGCCKDSAVFESASYNEGA